MKSRFRGCLLGGAVGDALGMATEEGPSRKPGQSIEDALGVAWVDRYYDSPNPNFLKAGQYTDDTQQTICLAETLLEGNGVFEARRFVDKIATSIHEQFRGIGPSTHRLIIAHASRDPRLYSGKQDVSQNPSNGAAMRVAPVALLYHWDLARLRAETIKSARFTHGHPTSIAGACAVAFVLAHIIRNTEFQSPAALRRELIEFIAPIDITGTLVEMISTSAVGVGDSCWIVDTVPNILKAFIEQPFGTYARAVLEQVNSDGDTDTKAAMLGGWLGAKHGIGAIPEPWLAGLENGSKGRDYLVELADQLLDLSLRLHGQIS